MIVEDTHHYRIGIDVGGTNTDAVLLQNDHVVSVHKAPTSDDLTQGITEAISAVLSSATCSVNQVSHVMVGTTHFINAIIEHKHLQPVASIRLCLPATSAVPPLIDWPEDLRRAYQNHVYLVGGGYEFDGREIAPLDEKAIRSIAKEIKKNGIKAAAITGVFAHVNADMELRAAAILREEIPEIKISLSSNVGHLGLLERENATIINSALSGLAKQVISSYAKAIESCGIKAPLFISQNDGTLMSQQQAMHYPVLTFASGATNSMRGAAYLSGIKDAVVVDIGGTSTDVGVLINGFPRQASSAIDIGGVRGNFPMPDVLSIGLGGGSKVVFDDGVLKIGPESVGYHLVRDAIAFGGDTLTATDIAIANGSADFANKSLVSDLNLAMIKLTVDKIHQLIADAIDKVKICGDEVPLILVGGGSVLISQDIAGVSPVIKPKHAEVANAIGAAIAQVSGEFEQICCYADIPRQKALTFVKKRAIKNAIAKGADPATVSVMQVQEVPLAYMPGNATRIYVKAVGDLMVVKCFRNPLCF